MLLWPLFCLSALGTAITSFSPTSGPPGTVVTIIGSSLSGATNVLFNSITYADFDIVSSTELQVVVPVGATTGPLTVVAGGASGTSSGTFTVSPTLTSFNPASGAHPTAVTIFGVNFVTGSTLVTFTGASPVNGTVTAQNQVVAVVPTNAADGPITVTTPAGSAVTASNFVVSTGPTVTDFSPLSGGSGTTVFIDGSNFLTNGTTVFFGAFPASSVAVVASTELQVVVPASATNAAITVTTSHGSYASSNVFHTGFTSGITDFSPAFGAPATTHVIIDGFGFGTSTGIIFAGVRLPSANITVSNDTQLQVVVPAGASNGPITVLSAHGSFTTSSNFLTSPGPVILDFHPATAAPGIQVTLDGFNFTGATSVKFGGKSVGVTVTQDNQVQATVPTGATNAPISISVGSITFTTSSNFVVNGAGPVIAGFTPSNGVQGMPVTISGNFATLGSPGVEFNGTTASYNLTSYNQAQAVVPAAATSGPITLLNSGGTATSSALFYVQPWITNFSPSSNIVNSTITIIGRNLTNATSLLVNGVPWNFTGNATQIVATVPSNALTGPLTLTAPGGVFIDTNVFKILPKIYSISPLVGPTNSILNLYGTSLFNVTNVQFGGVNATPTFATNGQVQVVVPYGAGSGPIKVFTPDGSAVSPVSFSVTTPSLVVLTKTASSQLLVPGSNVTYTLTVTNQGPSIISGLSITDNLPASLTYLSSTSTLGVCAFNNGVVTCNVGVLTNNLGLTITITGVDNLSGDLVNHASLNFLEGNLNASDNAASAEVFYLTPADQILSIQRLAAPPRVLLSWPNSGVPFLLEYTTNLASPTNWQTNTIPQTIVGNAVYVTNSTAGPSTFFQLKTH